MPAPTPEEVKATQAREEKRRDAAADFLRQYNRGLITVEELRDLLTTILLVTDSDLEAAYAEGIEQDRPCGCPADYHLSDCPIRTARYTEENFFDEYYDN